MRDELDKSFFFELRQVRVVFIELFICGFLIALDEVGAADDEEAPCDTAGENHGDDTGDCHVEKGG